jgi:hypothetical protein
VRMIGILVCHSEESRRDGATRNLSFWLRLAALFFLTLSSVPLRAQNPGSMMPEQSAAKAKELLQQMITATGGSAYLEVRDRDCTGKLSNFGHNNELMGFGTIHEIWKYPDKRRTEYSKQANVIDVYNGNQGWTLDRAGVHDQPADVTESFQEGLKRSIDYLVRYRLREEGLVFRFGGNAILDLKPVQWVEIADSEQRTLRVALDRNSHLPVRSTVSLRLSVTRERLDEESIYSNWHEVNGVQMPFQITRERDGRKIYQFFYTECRYNTGVTDDLFTKASLEKRWSEVGKKK